LGLAGQEGWLLAVGLIILPFVVLGVLIWLFLPDNQTGSDAKETVTAPVTG
jgi:hypothetical protein